MELDPRNSKESKIFGFAARIGDVMQSVPSRSLVRQLIIQLLRTDSDLNAFCLDYFSSVQKRFVDGMDRVQKVNLLLEVANPDDVLKTLRQAFPEEIRRLECSIKHESNISIIKQTGPQRILLVALVATILTAGSLLYFLGHPPEAPVAVHLNYYKVDSIGFARLIENEENPKEGMPSVVQYERDSAPDQYGKMAGWASWKQIYQAALEDPIDKRDQNYLFIEVSNVSAGSIADINLQFQDEPTPVRIRNLRPSVTLLVPVEVSGRHSNLTNTKQRSASRAWMASTINSILRRTKVIELELPDRTAAFQQGPYRGAMRAYPRFDMGDEMKGRSLPHNLL